MGEMSKELKPCPFLSDDWCTAFDEPCIVVCGDSCKEYERIKNRYGSLEKRNEELEAENERLRGALKEIAVFAGENFEKRILSPSCVTFETIKLWAEKALKGAGE